MSRTDGYLEAKWPTVGTYPQGRDVARLPEKLQLLVVTYPGVEQKQWVGRQLGTQNGSSELRPLSPKRVRIS